MGEISGFGDSSDPQGAIYEKCCQDMLEAGVHWIIDHPDAKLEIMTNPNVTGLFKSNTPETVELEKAVLDASFDPKTGHKEATGAQMHAVMMRLLYIAGHGWDKYVLELSKPEEDGHEN
jgi:hypothetical protein